MMTTPILLAAAAAIVGALGWLMSRSLFEAPVLQRTNHRGLAVPVGAGILIAAVAVTIEAVLRLVEIDARTVDPAEVSSRSSTLVLVLGFGLVGIFDDVAAHGDDRGFTGHLRTMASGRISTGGLKLVIGGLLAVIVTAPLETSVGDALLGAVLIALAANVGNLFDRAPGRTIKVGLLSGVLLLVLTTGSNLPLLVGPAVVVGASVGLLAFDLREELMLGDAGSNVIGAGLGLGLVLTTGRFGQIIAVIVLLVLNAASERISFTKVIDRTPPLRFLDRLGRRRS